MRTLCVVALLACAACRVAAPANTTPAGSALPASSESLVVARPDGLVVLAPGGQVEKRLVSHGVRLPRRVPNKQAIIYFNPTDGGLWSIDLDDSAPRSVAALPTAIDEACHVGAKGTPLAPIALEVAADGKEACLLLADSPNLRADRLVELRISLAGDTTQKGTPTVRLLRGTGCTAAAEGPPPCAGVHVRDRRPAPGKGARVENGVLHQEGKEPFTLFSPHLEEVLFSPDERWVLLAGTPASAPEVPATTLLLDRSSGRLFPVVDGPWPQALTEDELRLGEAVVLISAPLLVEAPPRWLSPDLLLLGELVVWIEHQGLRPGGEVAY